MTDVASETNTEPAASRVWIVLRAVDVENVRLEPGDEVTEETLPTSTILRLAHFGVLVNPMQLNREISPEDQRALLGNEDAKAHLDYVNNILREAREKLNAAPAAPEPEPEPEPEKPAVVEPAPEVTTEPVPTPEVVPVAPEVAPTPEPVAPDPTPAPTPTPDELRLQAIQDLLKEN